MFAGDFDEIFDGGVNHEAGNFDGATAKRTDDSIGAGVSDFIAGFVVAGTGDDLEFGIEHAGSEDDIHVIGVAGQSGSKRFGVFDPCALQDKVIGGVAMNIEPAFVFAGQLQAFVVFIDDDERFFAFVEVFTDGGPHATDATYDVVAVQI